MQQKCPEEHKLFSECEDPYISRGPAEPDIICQLSDYGQFHKLETDKLFWY